jgi:hypothetical protein
MRLRSALSLARELGPRGIAKVLRERAWSEHRAFGLASDLTDIPPVRSPKIAVSMQPRDPREFKGRFAEELERVTGADYVEVDTRIRFCEAGMEGLHVAEDPDGRPIYAHWLIESDNQAGLHRATHGLFPELAPHEALVEGAYTFVGFRSMGALAEGARQLLVKAAEKGATRCYTYVSMGNTPALRGANHAGFDVDHVRVTTYRAGRRRIEMRPPLPEERAVWEKATAPKPSPAAA